MATFPTISTMGVPDGGRSVRPAALSARRSGSETRLPSELEQLLLGVVADGFMLHCCGPIAAPFALVASYQWNDYVDLVTIRRFDWITTARVCSSPHRRTDVFAPEAVVWAYLGPPQPGITPAGTPAAPQRSHHGLPCSGLLAHPPG